jgi:endoglucanase
MQSKTVSLTFILAFLYLLSSGTTEVKKYEWQRTRGVNVSANISEQDIKELTEWGVDHIRLTFAVEPFLELDEPYTFMESTFANLDRVLDICEKYNIGVVIDPHKYPGTGHRWTMLGNDEFWNDYKWHDKVIAVWERIAKQCANRGGVIAGYALLNEPAIPHNRKENTPSDLNLLYKKLISAIRRYDKVHTIILSSPRLGTKSGDDRDYVDGLEYLQPQKDDNLCYEIHMYFPMEFSHQNVWEEGPPVIYPGLLDGELWDVDKMKEHLKPAMEFKEKHQVPVYVGEFSCPRWTGASGNQYLMDLISVYEDYSFSWAYHAYRESHIWDAEMNNSDRADRERKESTPRKELLIEAFRAK